MSAEGQAPAHPVRGPQLPRGTKVIDPRGRIGEVDAWLGGDDYRVTYSDGAVLEWQGNSLHLQKQSQRDLLAGLPGWDGVAMVESGLLFKAVTGSRLYGLETEASDTDIRGVFVAGRDQYLDLRWQLEPLQGVRPNHEEHYWEVGRFVWLALKADPNTLECLWSPHLLETTPEGDALIAMRQTFLSRHAFVTYGGYVLSQLRRLRSDLRAGTPNWKHAMHLARLLMAGTSVLRDGEMSIDAGATRARLLAVKRGQVSWDEYEAWRLELQEEFDGALATSPLPQRPDVDAALDFVLRLRAADVPRRRAASRGEVAGGADRFAAVDPRLQTVAASLGHRLIFATVSGAHLYGFASADSDWDLRASHAAPLASFAGLTPDGPDEVRRMTRDGDFELDLVSTEVGKFAAMLLKRNGYVLEQALSPLLVVSGAEHEELVEIARHCPTVHHAHHYLGFLAGQRREAERRQTVKALLYCVRVPLTGIWLMRTGAIEANLPRLLDVVDDAPGLDRAAVRDLIDRKAAGGERGKLRSGELAWWSARLDSLAESLEAARDSSGLPSEPSAALRRHVDDFVRRARRLSTAAGDL